MQTITFTVPSAIHRGTGTVPSAIHRGTGSFIPLIKAVRNYTGWHLKKCLDVVDAACDPANAYYGRMTLERPDPARWPAGLVDEGLNGLRALGCEEVTYSPATYSPAPDELYSPTLGELLKAKLEQSKPTMTAKDHLHEALVQMVANKDYYRAQSIITSLVDM